MNSDNQKKAAPDVGRKEPGLSDVERMEDVYDVPCGFYGILLKQPSLGRTSR